MMKFPDVPIERDSVGAMGWQGNQFPETAPKTLRPYVYRGKGYDIYEEQDRQRLAVKAKAEAEVRRRAAQAAKARFRRRRRAAEIRRHREVEARARVWAERKATLSERASVGWKPTSGGDIDTWLSAMEEE